MKLNWSEREAMLVGRGKHVGELAAMVSSPLVKSYTPTTGESSLQLVVALDPSLMLSSPTPASPSDLLPSLAG